MTRPSPTSLRCLALLAAGVALFWPIGMVGLNTFDEGNSVTGPMLLLEGKALVRDFFTRYGPAQFYLHAALFRLFGEQLWVVRCAHVVTLAGLGAAVYAVAERLGAGSWKAAGWTWLAFVGLVLFVQPVIGYATHLGGFFLLASVLALGAEPDRPGRGLALASALVGIAGTFRWDFGLFGLAALLVCTLLSLPRRPSVERPSLRPLLDVTAPCGVIWLAVYVPWVLTSGSVLRWFEEVFVFSLFEFEKWRGTELVGPVLATFQEAFGKWGPRALLARPTVSVLFLFLPPLIVLSSLAVLAARARRPGGRWPPDRTSLRVLYLSLAGLLLLNQMRVRPTFWQGFAAVSAALPLLPYLYRSLPAAGRPRYAARGAFLIASLLISAALANVGWGVARAIEQGHLVEAPLERARWIRLRPEQATYAELVDFVRRSTRPGEAIYSGVVDHNALYVNDVMIYFLADRPPADRFVVLEPGIANSRSGQREIVQSLEEQRVRLLVLLEARSTEPNLSSVPSGVTDLDDYIRAHYRLVRRIGPYRLMLRKAGGAD
jgi:hypothetical protein